MENADLTVRERYGVIAAGLTQRLEGCPEDAWDNPSPCPEWTARDIVRHVINVHRSVHSRVSGEEVAQLEDDDEIMEAWRAATSAIVSALEDEETAHRMVTTRFGETDFENLAGGALCADTLLHTWDIARATGQDERLDNRCALSALEFLGQLGPAMRGPNGFAPEVEVPAGSDPTARLLAFAGRSNGPAPSV